MASSDLYAVTRGDLENIRNAIQEKNGESVKYLFPNGFISAIANLSASSATAVTVTINGDHVSSYKGESICFVKANGAYDTYDGDMCTDKTFTNVVAIFLFKMPAAVTTTGTLYYTETNTANAMPILSVSSCTLEEFTAGRVLFPTADITLLVS